MDIWISSGTHVDDIAERVERIEERLGDPDVVFAEGSEKSTERDQLVSILRIIPYAPLLAIAVISQIYVNVELRGEIKSRITDGESGRDVDIVRSLTSRHDIEPREIDKEPLGQHVNQPIVWGIVNWGALLAITYFGWSSLPAVRNVIQSSTELLAVGDIVFIGFLAIAVGYFFLLVLLAVANYPREEAMAEVISDESGKYDRAVVVLGEGHHPGVGSRLTDEPGINVINPEPKDLDWQKRVLLRISRWYNQLRGR